LVRFLQFQLVAVYQRLVFLGLLFLVNFKNEVFSAKKKGWSLLKKDSRKDRLSFKNKVFSAKKKGWSLL
jgi:hypothetical protein